MYVNTQIVLKKIEEIRLNPPRKLFFRWHEPGVLCFNFFANAAGGARLALCPSLSLVFFPLALTLHFGGYVVFCFLFLFFMFLVPFPILHSCCDETAKQGTIRFFGVEQQC